MAKAINWPKGFETVVSSEDTEQIYCAIRPGRLYFDNRYWVDGEVVDIRVDQQLIRPGRVVGDLKCCSIAELTPDDLEKHKPGLQTVETIIKHLIQRYNQPIMAMDEVTVVYYRNLLSD